MAELKDRKQLQGLRNEGQTACCRSMKGDPSSSPQNLWKRGQVQQCIHSPIAEETETEETLELADQLVQLNLQSLGSASYHVSQNKAETD